MILGLLLLCLCSCTVTVRGPAAPERAVTVFVYTDAWHQGLILPHPGGGYVEFSYGEEEWFAFDQTSGWRLWEVLLLPTGATLVRRRILGRGPGSLDAAYPFQPRFALRVAQEAVESLRQELTARFTAGEGRVYFDPRLRRQFLGLEQSSYWFGHNCCDVLRQWLMRLGCEVGWAPVILGLAPAH